GKLMEVRTKLLGHPIHQMLVNFPLGLLPTAIIFDIIYLSTRNPRWADVAFWMIAAGIIGALIAAVFGLIDLLSIPTRTPARPSGDARQLHGHRARNRQRHRRRVVRRELVPALLRRGCAAAAGLRALVRRHRLGAVHRLVGRRAGRPARRRRGRGCQPECAELAVPSTGQRDRAPRALLLPP